GRALHASAGLPATPASPDPSRHRQAPQHTACAGAEQIRDDAGYLDVRFLQQKIQPAVANGEAAQISDHTQPRPAYCRRLHDDFLDLALHEPVGERPQLRWAGPDLLAFEVVLPVDLDVGHDDGQHLLVHVDSRDVVRHRAFAWWGAESVPRCVYSGSRAIADLTEKSRRPIIRSTPHAPDQTVARPRRIH